jgi:hypothetical protein
MSKCGKCGAVIEASETYEFAGEALCEDCYLEQRIKPVTCDPWAVYAAKRTKGTVPQLTEIQQRILDLIKTAGPLEASGICMRLGISETQFQNNFATLRHMELAKAFKDGDRVCYILF